MQWRMALRGTSISVIMYTPCTIIKILCHHKVWTGARCEYVYECVCVCLVGDETHDDQWRPVPFTGKCHNKIALKRDGVAKTTKDIASENQNSW